MSTVMMQQNTTTYSNLSVASCLSWYNSLSRSKHARSISKFLCTSVFQLWEKEEGGREGRKKEGREKERRRNNHIFTELSNCLTTYWFPSASSCAPAVV